MVLMWRSEDNGGSQVSSSIMCVPKIELEVVRFDSRGQLAGRHEYILTNLQ